MTIEKYCYIDFEFNNSKERYLNVLCAAWEIWEQGEFVERKSLWFETDRDRAKFREEMDDLIGGEFIFVSWAVVAEASSFYSLGIHPYRNVRWIDLYLEYRMLTNHNHKYAYGHQLIAGKPRVTQPPKKKWERTKADEGQSAPTEHSLAAAAYKMLAVQIDTVHKTAMRDLIIGGGPFTEQDKKDILQYCESDVKYLERLRVRISKANKAVLEPHDLKYFNKEMLLRGDYAARTAVMERIGHPFDYARTKNFSSHVATIIYNLQAAICRDFPHVKAFGFNPKNGQFKARENHLRQWIKDNHTDGTGKLKWELTDHPTNPKASLSLDAWFDKYPYKQDYPVDSFGARMVQFLRTKKAMNGFVPAKKKGQSNFWSYVGSDEWVRPYMGIYGSQSARSQPAATGFIPLKASWMRALIQPPPGYSYIAIDYASQEFLIGALLSCDQDMIAAYHSGDPYLHTAILAGAAPKDATSKTHSLIRNKFKSTVLGISYLMTKHGLAPKLTMDTGVPHTEEEAEELINLFNAAYPVYSSWRQQQIALYEKQKYLRLPCGWIMHGDNPNKRSVANFPVQGFGSSIMREAVRRTQDSGIHVAYTLHDELCALVKTEKVVPSLDRLAVAMDGAFRFYFGSRHNQRALTCRMDCKVWGPDFVEGETVINSDWFKDVRPVSRYIDKRSKAEYEAYQKYFEYEDHTFYIMNDLLADPPKA